jgi:hypothetical protein
VGANEDQFFFGDYYMFDQFVALTGQGAESNLIIA